MLVGIIATTVLTTLIVLDLVYDQELWDMNTSVTELFQQNVFDGEEVIFIIFSYLFYIVPIIALYGIIFLDNKLGSLLYGCMIVVTVSMNNVLKNAYHQPRPYMLEPTIQALECTAEFGKPSGHAMGSMVMCYLMPAILYPGIYFKQPAGTYYRNFNIFIRISVIMFITICVGITGAARVYLGVHSVSQVILGWIYSAYIMIIYIKYFHGTIQAYLTEALHPANYGISGKVVVIVLGITILLIGISILLLELNTSTFLSQHEVNSWLLAADKCYKYSPGTLTITSQNSMIIGFLIGLIISLKFSKGTYEDGRFRQNFRQLTKFKKFKRLILFLIAVAILVPFYFINTNNVYIQSFGQMMGVTIVGAISILWFYQYLLSKSNTNLQGDLLYIVNDKHTDTKSI